MEPELIDVSIGGTDAPHTHLVTPVNGAIELFYTDKLNGLSVNGLQIGESGGKRSTVKLRSGEYWSSFKINSNHSEGIITAVELKTNKGRVLQANRDKLPTGSNPSTSVIVDNCYIYAIGVISDECIHQLTIYYIKDFEPFAGWLNDDSDNSAINEYPIPNEQFVQEGHRLQVC